MGRDVNVKIEGAIRGTGHLGLDAHEVGQEKISVGTGGSSTASPDAVAVSPPPSPDGIYTSELLARSGRFERSTPLAFVPVGPELPVLYPFDFDRDAAKEWVLENSRLRLIVSPEDGGRALALVDKTTGANLTTPVGALRDLFALPDAAGGPPVLRDLTFNRPYRAEKIEEQKKPALRLRYRVPELAAGGAEIEKTLRLSEPETVEVAYQVALPDSAGTLPALVVMHSVFAQSGGDRSTRFCWAPPGATEEAATRPAAPAASAAATDCAPFTPGGAAILPPLGVRWLVLRTPGQPRLVLAWDAGRLRIEPKTHSALLMLEFPALTPGGSARQYNLRYTVLPVE